MEYTIVKHIRSTAQKNQWQENQRREQRVEEQHGDNSVIL
jgi:hypothetical protein